MRARPFGSACAAALVALAIGSIARVASAQITPPHAKEAAPPVIPAGAKPIHAHVSLVVVVDASGAVIDVEVTKREPADAPEAYVAAAIAYAKSIEFVPATFDGSPLTAKLPFEVTFDPPPPPPPKTNPKPAPPPPPPPAASIPIEEPVVNLDVEGHIERPHGLSDTHFDRGALAIIPVANASEVLKSAAPSILLTNEGGEGHAEQVFLRGFDAREGQDLEFTVGGVPINDSGNLHGNGYADTHFIIPELVGSLRVIEGPYAPQQGNYAVAGSADYELGLAHRGLTAKYTVGSFGTERMLMLWGPPGSSEKTFGGVEIYSTHGFGMNRDAKRGTAMGQYEGKLGEKGSFRVTGTAYSTSFHTAGVLREDDYDAGRVGFYDTYDPLQGGNASRYSLALDLSTASDDVAYRQLFFVVDREMRLRENFTGFLLDVQSPFQTPHAQRGDLLDLEFSGVTAGARGSARFKGKAFDLPQELELGYYARADHTNSTQSRIEAATGHPYHLDADFGSTLGDLALYADANLKALKWLSFRGGVRADIFTFDVLDRCAVQSVAHPSPTNTQTDQSCLSQEGFGQYREPTQRSSTAAVAILPRATMLVGPIDGFTFALSYGTGVRSIDPAYVTQDTDTPFAKIKSYEGGVGYLFTTDDLTLSARSVFFQTKVDRDLVFSETEGRNVLGGGTTRTGWVGSGRATGDFFDESASVTLVRSEFDDTHLLVPYVPDLVIRSDTAIFHDLPFLKIDHEATRGAIGAGVSYVGHRALPYGERSDVIFTVDSTASIGWKGYEVALVATNLLGRKYRLGEFNYASDFHTESQPTLVPMRHFTAGAPRALFVSFSATLGGR